MSKKKTIIISVVILVVGGAITTLIFMTEPTAERVGAARETAMLVDVIRAERGNYTPTISATGTVVPAQDIFIRPRVSGEIIRRSPAFIPGGFVKKGEVLLKIDPSDYRNTLQLRESELHQAEADLHLEMGRQDVARRDYQLLDDTLRQENRSLVLREPQLRAARARVEAARSSVNQAELELQRTTIRAPFNAQIITQNVNVGSQVSPGDNLCRLVGVDTYWVMATVPLSKVPWLTFPDGEREMGSIVRIRNRTAWPEGVYREGYLYKLIGALEDQTRLARVLVTIPDPIGYNNSETDKPSLIIGSFMETRINANELNDLIRLSRDYIRNNETVWVMEDDELRIREVNIVFQDPAYAYIDEGINENDRIVTTNISTVVDGAKLRLRASGEETGQQPPSDASEQ